ncbi:MAG: FAD-dependent oxidoreductase [candidate division Zixibacteria bacterium]|nr:FAD-dependent oxidoreductase [candidate division Zixibacteria bacterium]
MERLKTIEEFNAMRQRLEIDHNSKKPTIVIPAGTCGQASGANDLIRVTKREILKRNLTDRIALRVTGCHGFCQMEPSVLIDPGKVFYPTVNMKDMVRIVEAVAEGTVVEDLLYVDPATGQRYEKQSEIPFFNRQTRTILSRNERLDPIRLYNYLNDGGYASFVKVLRGYKPVEVVEEVKKSGIRGRGGAGFPTGLKWEMLAAQKGEAGKFLVCNADEGDPGAYMDRSVLEGNPHSVIEGMLIGAFATGANEGVMYIRNEYPLAIKHVTIALRQAADRGLLGKNILGTDFSFDISLVRGAGAFVCGEETALIKSIEGHVGEPQQRPPYPVQKGIEGKPTVINNVESWANISIIIDRGADEYVKVGVPGNTGTKIFSLVGKIKNTGLVEVPLGMKISEVVYDIGGGPSGDAKIKAVQTGGPSGGCIPASMFDLPIDYDSLNKVGSIMGSGGMIVMDENTCMVDVAKYFMSFLKEESCGKCYTCRKGTQRMYEILDDITSGRGTMEQLDLLEELALVVKDTTMCGLGQSASNPILTTLRHFRHEFEAHIKDHRCEAFVCRDLVGAPCQSACPLGTEAWHYIAHITEGEYEKAYHVIRQSNPFPSVCGRVCHHPCESRCRAGTSGGEAIAIRSLKRFVTDRIDPATYQPHRESWTDGEPPRIAIVGSGPAGLTTAHYLSLKGCKVTIFEAEDTPGGMLYCAIPSYRLPREVIKREIDCLLDENVTLQCNTALGRDISVDGLLEEGYKAVLLALGAHKSKPLRLENEDAEGVYASIEFLKAFNVHGEQLGKGRIGVIGGGNSAIDAARMALRQKEAESVTILYRRTRDEMPAFAEEIEATDQEGITVRTLVTPTRVITKDGHLTGLEFVRNELGDTDSSGRRRPVPIKGTEDVIELDTLIVAIGEDSGVDAIGPARLSGVETTMRNTVKVDSSTLLTNRQGVFAAGDVVTGPNTVVDAIADGKKAAVMIERYLKNQPMLQPTEVRLPSVYVEPASIDEGVEESTDRTETPRAPAEWRTRNFAEVEVSLSIEEATCEARRCLRCDLEFTKDKQTEPAKEAQAVEGK